MLPLDLHKNFPSRGLRCPNATYRRPLLQSVFVRIEWRHSTECHGTMNSYANVEAHTNNEIQPMISCRQLTSLLPCACLGSHRARCGGWAIVQASAWGPNQGVDLKCVQPAAQHPSLNSQYALFGASVLPAVCSVPDYGKRNAQVLECICIKNRHLRGLGWADTNVTASYNLRCDLTWRSKRYSSTAA